LSQSLMDAEKKLLEEISFAVFATGPGLNDLSETARIEIDEKLVEKHCTLCTSPKKTDTEISLTVKVCGLIRTLHFVQGRNPA